MTPPRAPSGEKFTATISTFIVLGIVAGVLTAQPAGPTLSDRLAQLQSDLTYQLDLAYRLDKSEREQRQSEFDRTMAAWQASPQTETDAALFAQWFQEAIDRSLPARREPLPAAPKFGESAEVVAAPAKPEAEIVASENSRTNDAPTGNPPSAPPLSAKLPRATQSAKQLSRPAIANLNSPPAPPAPPVSHSIATQRPIEHVVAKPVIGSSPNVAAGLPVVAQPERLAPPQPAAVPVAVNLDELNARITGYHEGLAEVMAAAVSERRNLSLEKLTSLVDEIEELASQRQFVALYYDSLTDDERQAVIKPRPVGPAVKLLQSALADATRGEDDDDFLRPFEADEHDVADLDARLQKLAGEAGK